MIELKHEADIMVGIKSNPNVVKVIGMCLDPKKPVGIVTEYCSRGSLKKSWKQKNYPFPKLWRSPEMFVKG